MSFKQLRFTVVYLFIVIWLTISFQETALALPRLDTCASRFGCTAEEIRNSDSRQEDFQDDIPKMAKTVEFKITATPPLVDTASGLPSVLDEIPHQKELGKLIIFPRTTEEKERAAKLGRRSDIGVFTFVSDKTSLSLLCQKIATQILSKTGIEDNKILVEGAKADSVISLKNINALELADRIFATATAI